MQSLQPQKATELHAVETRPTLRARCLWGGGSCTAVFCDHHSLILAIVSARGRLFNREGA